LCVPGRERLAGIVEVDETLHRRSGAWAERRPGEGQEDPDRIAVEIHETEGVRPLPNCAAFGRVVDLATRLRFGSHRAGRHRHHRWLAGLSGLDKLGYCHEARNQRAARARGEDPAKLLPAVHRVASLAKRWLLGTHQGSVDAAHLPSYLNEFVFRFNRRHSKKPRMVFYRVLELAVAHDPVRYADIVARRRPRAVPPSPPRLCPHPPSLDQPPAGRPWRAGSG